MNRRFARACLVGALVAGLVFAWILFVGRAELADQRPAGDFYDAQARALFDGQWDLPPEVLSIEAFEVDGRSYTYFGPVPALLRMPVLAVTDSLDGRLTQLSMLGAFGVVMLGVSQLSWRVRLLVRGEALVHRREAVITALFVFGVGAGSVATYLASQAVVYHEAILWGIAWSLLAFHALLGFLARPGRRALAWTSLFVSLAVLTRASVGVGPLAALAAVVGVVAIARFRGQDDRVPGLVRWATPGVVRRPPARLVGAAVIALLVPVGLYAGVNQAKFGEPIRLPLEKQVFSEVDPARQAALADNDGSLFGLRFVPTTALQAVRPDALSFQRYAPWVSFPRSAPDVIGGATFDTLDESSSATATMPLLVVLGVLGSVVVVRGRPSEDDVGVGVLRLPVLGALVGFAATLTIAFVAHRYLGDALPLLLLTSLAGLHTCGRRFGGPRTAGAVAVGVAFLLLGTWGVLANVALALDYQRVIAPVDPELRYDFVGFQAALPAEPRVRFTTALSDNGQRGDMTVVGDCDALLWSDGHQWYLLEGDPDALDEVPVFDETRVVTVGARPGADLCHRLIS
jgi:hypothetical protein